MAGLENLVAAAAFPDHAANYWRRALEVRPVVLSGLVAKFAQTRAADSRVVVEGFVSAPGCMPVHFRFSVLFRHVDDKARIAGRLPLGRLKFSGGVA